MTAGELHDKLSSTGAHLMARALDLLAQDALTFTPQAATGITYAEKISKAEAVIDWSRDAADLHNLVRGLSPFPGAAFFADLGKGPERVKVLRSRRSTAGAPGTVLDDALTIACGRGAAAARSAAGRPGADERRRISARDQDRRGHAT